MCPSKPAKSHIPQDMTHGIPAQAIVCIAKGPGFKLCWYLFGSLRINNGNGFVSHFGVGVGSRTGVTGLDDAGRSLVPTALVAVTVKVYVVPLANPSTVEVSVTPSSTAVRSLDRR